MPYFWVLTDLLDSVQQMGPIAIVIYCVLLPLLLLFLFLVQYISHIITILFSLIVHLKF